jgi:predicted nucleic acid-binding protein
LNLAIVGQIDLLCRQFGQIQIPPAVLDELKIDEERPGSEPIQAAIAAGWIQVQPVSNQPLVQLLRQTLDGGEAEAIALALELAADWTLLDERDGRKVAKSLGLHDIG